MRTRVEVYAGPADRLVGTGTITDEPATSSYGLPVFVSDRDGRMYGPADEPLRWCTVYPLDAPGQYTAAVEGWLVAGGWSLAFGLPQ